MKKCNFLLPMGKSNLPLGDIIALEIIAAWKLEQCMIHVKHNTEQALQYCMEIKKLKNNKLYLFDSDSQSEVVYKFVK